jgi:hypothetical protein
MQFLFPVPATSIVTQSFAEHVHSARVNGWQNYNGGIDWAVPTGTQVVAAQAGVVTAARHDATGYGTHLRIQHDDGYLTVYGHMWDFTVKVGDKVRAGAVIGRSDNTGNSTGPHIHFELRRNNVPVDPAPLLTNFLPDATQPGGGGVVVNPGGGPVIKPAEPTDGSGSQPGGGVTVGEEPESFPSLPNARIISTIGLNIRMAPGVFHPIVGFLPSGTQVEVMRKAQDGEDVWLQIGHQQYVAMIAGGDTYAVWVAAPPAALQSAEKPRRSRRKPKS